MYKHKQLKRKNINKPIKGYTLKLLGTMLYNNKFIYHITTNNYN